MQVAAPLQIARRAIASSGEEWSPAAKDLDSTSEVVEEVTTSRGASECKLNKLVFALLLLIYRRSRCHTLENNSYIGDEAP
jgi:hypothetical protein